MNFISPAAIEKVGRHYASYETIRLLNQITHRTVEDFMTWLTNHNTYIAELKTKVASQVQHIIREKGSFVMTKNVLGVRFVA